MVDDHKDNNEKQALSEKDAELWAQFTQDIKPLKGRQRQIVPQKSKKPDPEKTNDHVPNVSPHLNNEMGAQAKKVQSTEIDKNTERRLRRGDIKIEGKLDLHGMNQGQARQALIAFIRKSSSAGKRCVLVVTGKGVSGQQSGDWLSPGEGVLKRNVPDWLFERELDGLVLKAIPAQPKDGGSGALYVYLRRRR